MRRRLRNFRCQRRLTKCHSTFKACHKLELIPNMWFAAGFIFKYLAAPFFIKPATPNSNSFQTMKYRVEQPYCRPTLPTAVTRPNPEHQPNIDSAGAKRSDTPKKKTIYIAGWEKTTKGITMAFVTDDGEPFYPKTYIVRKLYDCSAEVTIDGSRQHLTYMPDSIAFGINKNDSERLTN
jgi:hypothetical protein